MNNDITWLRPRLAKALRLRIHIKSMARLNENVAIYKTDEYKITFENFVQLT